MTLKRSKTTVHRLTPNWRAVGRFFTILTALTVGLLGWTGAATAGSRLQAPVLNLPSQLGSSNGYHFELAFPNLPPVGLVGITAPPGDSRRVFLVDKTGIIWVVTNVSSPNLTAFLNISDRTVTDSESGLTGLTFHPNYASNGWFYVFYSLTTNTDSGFGLHQRIARFSVDPSDPNHASVGSEFPLITQFDRDPEHQGGTLQFGPDGYLYVGLGDEGGAFDAYGNAQRIDGNFFSAILRLDVDQLQGNLPPNHHPAVNPGSYSVPADNPWIGATNFAGTSVDPSTVRTEFYAVGFRNPFRFAFDSVDGRLFVADVGQNRREEIDLVRRGGNYGWHFFEGTLPVPFFSPQDPAAFESPVFEYEHQEQRIAVSSTLLYHGAAFPELEGALLFNDFGGAMGILRSDSQGQWKNQWLPFGTQPSSVTDLYATPDTGDVLAAVYLSGVVAKMARNETAGGVPPSKLSDTGIFADLSSLTPVPGVEPYEVNVPFWSDHATKHRWFVLPTSDAVLGYTKSGAWQSPAGTMWVKHFDLNVVTNAAVVSKRVETRVLVRTTAGIYGVTYRWRDDQSDADLVPDDGADVNYLVQSGSTNRLQTWHYPGRGECLVCHNSNAGYSLGFNTPQLNRSILRDGVWTNQIQALAASGYFSTPPSNPQSEIALTTLGDLTATREWRVRSYLAANCTACHFPGGPTRAQWDARPEGALGDLGIVGVPALDDIADPSDSQTTYIVNPGDLQTSSLYLRLANQAPYHMPPLATSEINEEVLPVLSAWITNDLPAAIALASFTWATNDGSITITAYTGDSPGVEVPYQIGGLPVTQIGDEAFAYSTTVTNVVLPEGVTSLGEGVFTGCSQLRGITLPAGLTSIGDFAFYNSGLAQVNIPPGLTNIGYLAFAFCSQLSAFAVDSANPAFSAPGGVLMDKAQTLILQYPIARTNDVYRVPDRIVTIADESFAFSKLTQVELPSSLSHIGFEAFFECANLAQVSFPRSLTQIDGQAFGFCHRLTRAYFSGDAPGLGHDPFFGDPMLTVYYLRGNPGWTSRFGGVKALSLPVLNSVSPPDQSTGVEPDAVIQAQISDGDVALDSSTLSLTFDGVTVTPSLTKSGNVTTVSYVPKTPLASLTSHTATLTFFMGGSAVSRSWSFAVLQQSYDRLNGYRGELQNGAVFTPDGGGHTGLGGDHAIDFGNTIGGIVYIKNTAWINAQATVNDTLAVSFWLKRPDITSAGSVFLFDSPSTYLGRAFHAHVPWLDDHIYFDTSGCCSEGSQRIHQSIVNFPGYSAVGNDSWWTGWHHLVLQKSGPNLSEIWIDGQLFWSLALEGNGPSLPLPTDIDWLTLGGYVPGPPVPFGSYMPGLIDDFAIFGAPLGAADISSLFAGTAPDHLPPQDLLLAYWPFDDAPSLPSVTSVSPADQSSGVEPDTVIQAQISDGDVVLDPSTVSLTFDGVTVTPSLTKAGNVTTVSYIPTTPLTSSSSHAATLAFGKGRSAVSRSWSFSVLQQSYDRLNAYPGELQNGAVFTPDGGGHTGLGGDRAIDFGNPVGGIVYIKNTAWINAQATVNDTLAVSFWLKRPDITSAGSVFLFDSPSTYLGRAFHAHLPWLDDNIYFDTAGCCLEGSQRIHQSIVNFPGYAAVGNDSWWTGWHHFVLQKSGPNLTEIWIDGQLFWSLALEGNGPSLPLPTDIDWLALGGYVPGPPVPYGSYMPGWIDDFAIFGAPLGAADISSLFSGTAPDQLPPQDLLLAYWPFDDAPSVPSVTSVSPADQSTGIDPNPVIQVQIMDGSVALDPTTLQLALDGVSVTSTQVRQGNLTTVSVLPIAPFPSHSSHTVTVSFGRGANAVTHRWSFTTASLSLDKVNGFFAELELGAHFTPDAGGHSGRAGDRAIDFGAGGDVYVKNTGWINAQATIHDTLAVSFWMKRPNINTPSSAFLFDSPSSYLGRAFHAHLPWMNDVVAFDTSGCCAEGSQRILQSISAFPGYAAVGNDAWWNSWHHYVFQKSGSQISEIWIDGQKFWSLAQEGYASALPLPTDIDWFTLGAYTHGSYADYGNYQPGLMDDFAVFGTLLGEADVKQLFTGAAPDDPSLSQNRLLAYWPFDDGP